MRYLTFLLLFFAISQQFACGNNEAADKLLGKWEGTARETVKGRKTTFNGQPLGNIAVYEFREKGTLVYHVVSPPEQGHYSIHGDELTIGSMRYVIEKLTEQELVLVDIVLGDRNAPSAFRHFFKRIN